MPSSRSSAFLSSLAVAAVAALLPLLAACPTGDIGAPCNHGPGEPTARLVTFPALSCDDLICVYGAEEEPPDITCSDDSDCQSGGAKADQFVCNISGSGTGTCAINDKYVLRRSMCSKKCTSDDDCKNTGATTEKKPVTEDTACEGEFKCARLQELGDFCCERLCVCEDDLGSTAMIDQFCQSPSACESPT